MSCEDIVGVVGDTLGVFTSAHSITRRTAAAAVDASFAEVTEAPKSEVTTSSHEAATSTTDDHKSQHEEREKRVRGESFGTTSTAAFSQPFFCFEGQHPHKTAGC